MQRIITTIQTIILAGFFTIIFFAGPSFGASSKTGIVTKIKSLSKIPGGFTIIAPSIKFGPELRHVAYAAYKDKNTKIIVHDADILPGIYHAIRPGYPIFPSSGNRIAYIAYTGAQAEHAIAVVDGKKGPVFDNADHLIFSPDGKRYAYRADKGKKECVVVDGRQERFYDGIPIDNNFLFSPDSKHFAYVALKNGKCLLVQDGIESSETFPFIKDIKYSLDSKHIAYKARVEKTGGQEKWSVVYDHHTGNVYARIFDLIFSYDSKHLAYLAIKNRKIVLVLDKKEIESHDMMGVPVFSPDSESLAYGFKQNNSWHTVVNGKESPGFDLLGKFYFSFDSKHYAYFARDGDKWYCIVDGQKGENGFKKGMNAFKFSFDSKHYAYAGIHDKGASIVYDGKSGPVYESIGEPYFSLDSRHIVYRAKRKKDGKWMTVLDGKISASAYNGIGKYYFSNDSRHLAYNALISINKSIMVVDGHEQCGKDHFKIIGDPYFSPDSNHLAYVVRAGKNIWKIVVDGQILPETYAGFMKGTPIIYDSPNHFHTIGFKMPGPEFISINVNIPKSSKLKTSITGTSIK